MYNARNSGMMAIDILCFFKDTRLSIAGVVIFIGIGKPG